MRQYAWLLIGAVAAVLCGCNIDVGNAPATVAAAGVPKALRGQIGKPCTVQFRRDALGAAMNIPASPTTGGINGADVTVAGILEAVDNDWLVVKSGSQGLFIRQAAVLMIQVDLERNSAADHSDGGHH